MRFFLKSTTLNLKSSAWLVRAAWVLMIFAVACGHAESEQVRADAQGHGSGDADEHGTESEAKGPNGGRLLRSGSFEIELGIFERGVPPEYRAWAWLGGKPLDPSKWTLQVSLARLGGRVDRIVFDPLGDHLVSTTSIAEPHSFEVSIETRHGEDRHVWSFESFEGRTRIDSEMAASLDVESEVAGAANLIEVVTVYGDVRTNPERVRELRARFEGKLHKVLARVGDRVRKGESLLEIESNESLNRYTVEAPISGVVTQRDANSGEQTSGRLLMTITDTSSVWVDLALFPVDRSRVEIGQRATITPALGGDSAEGVISVIEPVADPHDQSVNARVELDKAPPHLLPGTFVTAGIHVGERSVPLAVRRMALQGFRDFRVVYAVVDDVYEVRMLELGSTAGDWVEVLGGLEPGTRYVTRNSYLIKADIEKSGASHDH